MDERRGRKIAGASGLTVVGLLGVLAEAKNRAFIPACKPLLDEMMAVAGFWIGELSIGDTWMRLGSETP